MTDRGINIPETILVEPNDKTSLINLFEKSGWHDAILKPAISGTARHTYRISPDNLDVHEKIFQELIANESMLLQKFQTSILTKGEISLMFFGGKYSHAVLKIAKPGDFRVQDDFGGSVESYQPTQFEITLAERALGACTTVPIYARVDIVDDNMGNPAVAELELVEPELWFRLKPAAAHDLANAVVLHINELN